MIVEEIQNIENNAIALKLGKSILGGAEAMDFSKRISEIGQGNYKKVVIDLSSVDVLNSSGLGMIVSAYTSLKKQNIALSLAAVPEKIYAIFSITQLDKILTFDKDLESAFLSK